MIDTVELPRRGMAGNGRIRAVGDGCNEGEDSRREAGDPLEVEAAALGDRDSEGDMGGETGGRYADGTGEIIE